MKVIKSTWAILWLTLNSALPLQAEVIVEKSIEEAGEVSIEHRQSTIRPESAPMRIEEPDGTLQPLPSVSLPKSRMSTEDLQHVPDAGGGKMVNVEGRFQSILKVPDGADQAIHQHDPESPQLKP